MNRLWRWVFVAVQALMLNVVIPGHTRGQITVAGYDRKTPSCCCSDSSDCKTDKPTSNDVAHCAVCYFAAGLAVPPPTMAAPTLFGFVSQRPPEIVIPPISAPQPLPLSARGPPR